MDFVLTVCGNAANEVCPVWPGRPATAHWGVDDPAAIEGSREDQLRAFSRALHELEARVRMLVELPLGNLDKSTLEERLRAIGRSGPRSAIP
jgi:arsenate reductase